MENKPSAYESTALREVHAWKNPELGWFGQAMRVINQPLDKAGGAIFATPGLGDAIKKAFNGIMAVSNDVAQWSVRPETIYAEFRSHGHSEITKVSDVFTLDLSEVDKVIGWLDAKYKEIALVEGAATGAVGLPGIPPDVITLVTLNLRAIGEYATYCGFDVSNQAERLFALNVLGLASSPTDGAKGVAMGQLVRIAQEVAKKRAWKQLEKEAFVKIVQKIAKAIGVRLTKAKLAQTIPIAGALIGGGFNTYYTAKVCDAAFYLYRERFVAEKYGPSVIEETVKPAEDLKPDYEEGSALLS
ncbi:MAG: EcsC family protein [bacterium]